MGWITHVFVVVCFLGLSFGNSNVHYANSNNPLNFDQTEQRFANVFIRSVINSREFGKNQNMDFQQVTQTLIKSISLLKQRASVDPTQKKALMLAFCSSIAELIVEQCDAEVATEEKTRIVTNALRNAYLATTGQPNEDLINEVKFLVGIFLAVDDNDGPQGAAPYGYGGQPGGPRLYGPARGPGFGGRPQRYQYGSPRGFPYNPRGPHHYRLPTGQQKPLGPKEFLEWRRGLFPVFQQKL